MKGMLENVFIPEETRTQDSLSLLWDKPYNAVRIKEYQIFVDSKLYGKTNHTDYTVNGLEPDTDYELYVQAVNKDGTYASSSYRIAAATRRRADSVSIADYGAVGDGKTLNTEAIQKAIRDCCRGGRVIIPKGIYVSGALYLKSSMTLYLEEGAVLLGSDNPEDYPVEMYRCEGNEILNYASLINSGHAVDHTGRFGEGEYREIVQTGGYVPGASRLHDITIEGKGIIDANGKALMKREFAQGKAARGRAVSLRNVDRVYMKDVTVRQSPAWCIHMSYCSEVSLNHVSVYTRYDENGELYGIVNCDGFNPDSCSGVKVFNSLFNTGDDSIAVKSGWNEEGREVGIPCENVRITNCSFEGGFGVAMGSEMSGGIRHVLVQDCRFQNTYSIASIKAPRGRGGVVEDICYEDIDFNYSSGEHRDNRWFRGAIYIDQFYSYDVFDLDTPHPVDESTPRIRDIVFRNIRLDTVGGNAIYLAGLPEQPLENVFLDCVQARGKYGLVATNIRNLNMRIVNVKAEKGENFRFRNVDGKTFTETKFD